MDRSDTERKMSLNAEELEHAAEPEERQHSEVPEEANKRIKDTVGQSQLQHN